MGSPVSTDEITADLNRWMREFVAVRNDFYGGKFAPCPFAQRALTTRTVDVAVWQSGNAHEFVRRQAIEVRDSTRLTTRVMTFPPRMQVAWGFSEHVERLNAELARDDVFLNTGIAKTTISRYPGSGGKPYFIVVANRLAAVLKGSEALQRTAYYAEWPPSQVEIVVERRARLARRHALPEEAQHG
jgi:hypothetical protein